MYTLLWFGCNICFVALLILFLFQNRSYQEARSSGDTGRAAVLNRRRLLSGMMAVVAFVAMAAVLLIDMHLNG
ncbi:hypothetical protein [Paenibacillus tarimensis]|uniref:hypothetical protein n=1 Tax=Paenibacillus tarimensis TaxID=416012 RepID=UPI001F17BDF7|nr:hypothetical protein [Paenibacillus tarimensis]MCF2942404.1 hypothetical protein [Paenibacillus tarimensis]